MQRLPRLNSSVVSRAALLAGAALSLAAAAQAQANHSIGFSLDWKSPTVGMPDSLYGLPITEGDVLVPPMPSMMPAFAPLLTPAISVKAGPHGGGLPPHLGLMGHPGCMGHPGGTPCTVEVDALDIGRADMLLPNTPIRNRVYFSTDQFAVGFGAGIAPSIASEAPVGDLAGDALVSLGLGVAPLAPFAGPMIGSTGVIDGNGAVSGSGFTYRGIGEREPNMPVVVLPSTGDNLDALVFMTPTTAIGTYPAGGVYFSLDAAWPDPLTGIPNSGSAAAHGFAPGAVLWTPVPGGLPVLYAPPAALGLDFAGPGRDDLDALSIRENGIPGYQVAAGPYAWAVAVGGPDQLIFSVRRGSAVIGMPDSIFGMPICEGDLLIPPVMGGLSPFPGIFVAAENLGLSTMRSMGTVFSDELDALEIQFVPVWDCNGNGREDALDIAMATSLDTNGNGIPDECEVILINTPFCFCPAPLGPCGNNFAAAGCRNSTGVGGLMTATGSSSVAADNLLLTVTGMPTFQGCVTFMSATTGLPVPFGDGRRCLFGTLSRFPVQNTGATGSIVTGPGLVAYSLGFFPVVNQIIAGSTFGFQTWYRDPAGPCGSTTNISSGEKVTFVP